MSGEATYSIRRVLITMRQAGSQQVADEVASRAQSPGFSTKLLLLLLSVVFCLVLFVALDATYCFLFQKSAFPTLHELVGCKVADPTRVYALRPDCSSIRAWGHERYSLSVNSEGFRDKLVREVPPTDPRPRMLMLGDSFTESMGPWDTSFVGRLAARFPQYEFLNGGVDGYSPSTYLTTARLALTSGLDFDEVIVFMDISDVQDEAALYYDVGAMGAVAMAQSQSHYMSRYSKLRFLIAKHLVLTNSVWEFVEGNLVRLGWYHLNPGYDGNVFDRERSAWTYRQVSDGEPYEMGYAPLGVEGGIAKEKRKMDLLWQELARRNIPLSVVVYPWPAQLVHDSVDSREVRIWRDWCEGKCKRFVTAFPAFFAAKEQCPKWEPGCWYIRDYIFGDVHFNAGGNGIISDVVGRALKTAPPIKRPPTLP